MLSWLELDLGNRLLICEFNYSMEVRILPARPSKRVLHQDLSHDDPDESHGQHRRRRIYPEEMSEEETRDEADDDGAGAKFVSFRHRHPISHPRSVDVNMCARSSTGRAFGS